MTAVPAFDFVIVGGGVVALSIGWEILRCAPRSRLAIVRPREDDGSASRAAGAMLSGFCETTRLSLATPAGRAKVAWRVEAAQLWPEWAAELGEACGDPPLELYGGTILIANAVSGPLDQWNFDATLRLLQDRGENFSVIDPAKDLGVRPVTADRPMQAIHIPGERYVDSSRVLGSLRAILKRSDRITWIDGECTRITRVKERSRAYAVRSTEGHTIEAAQVILAAGVHSLQPLSDEKDVVSRIPPLLAGAGAAIQCERQDEPRLPRIAIRTPNRAFACGLHVLLSENAGPYIGATNNVQVCPARQPLLSDVSFLIDSAIHQIDRRLASFPVKEIRVGNRPVSIDTFPLVGETSLRGVWIVSGTYRDGFLLAPLLARRLFQAMREGSAVLAGGEHFLPERVPIPCADLETAIHESVENYLAIALERRLRLPAVGIWEDEFRGEIERRVRRIYAELGTIVPPDFLWDLEHGTLLGAFKRYYGVDDGKRRAS